MRGAPVDASELAPDAAVATVGALTGPALETRAAGAGAPSEADADEGVAAGIVAVDGDVVGCGHEASALPSSAACTPQIVTGSGMALSLSFPRTSSARRRPNTVPVPMPLPL